ncbi:MAG: hypothetical protein Q4G25_09185 [Paracoccus sp. (in: a-proteobacteria)]|nr:hypothetical protein [Paracoccus sp. (in: a-proteobacteria)]
MKRLIEKKPIFGSMIRLDGPVRVRRHNRALRLATGRETALAAFHIDLAGFPPVIGREIRGMAGQGTRPGSHAMIVRADERS